MSLKSLEYVLLQNRIRICINAIVQLTIFISLSFRRFIIKYHYSIPLESNDRYTPNAERGMTFTPSSLQYANEANPQMTARNAAPFPVASFIASFALINVFAA